MQELESWIYKELVGEDECINTSAFSETLPLYITSLANNFVATIINGHGTPATFKVNPGEYQYNHIIKQVAFITDKEPAVWFYYTVIDNAVGTLNDVWDCNYEFCLDFPLEKFEREPAEEGGVSFLGLLGKNRAWLLLHTYEPGESFEISFHSSASIVKRLESVLVKNN